jgi:hypothetical protein
MMAQVGINWGRYFRKGWIAASIFLQPKQDMCLISFSNAFFS